MPNWLAWTLTLGFGALNLLQFFQYWVDRKARDAHKTHILAMKRSLQALRQMCSEAIDIGETIKTDAARQWVRQVAWTLVGIEGHVDALLELPQAKFEQDLERKLRNEINQWILSGNELAKLIGDSPGIRDPVTGQEPPSSELEQQVDEWIKEVSAFIVNKCPWFEGQFRSDAGLPPSGVIGGKHYKFSELKEKVERRIARLVELLAQVSPPQGGT
jgi:hypothetical protein